MTISARTCDRDGISRARSDEGWKAGSIAGALHRERILSRDSLITFLYCPVGSLAPPRIACAHNVVVGAHNVVSSEAKRDRSIMGIAALCGV